jgi:3-hydroxyisobutyrate dehydrogenase
MADRIVALLGTGTMGAGMARNIGAAGLDLRVWNGHRERAEPLADVATVAGTAAAARLADELGVLLVDAPVLGTTQPALDGALVVLASGPEETRERVGPVLEAIGSRTLWVGPAGAGTRLKLVANHWVFTVLEGVAETLALARSHGLDPALLLDAVKGGGLDAPYVQLKGRAMLDGSYDPAFALAGAHKDSELILEAAREGGFEAELLAVINRHLARGVEAGHGDLDMAATYLTH